MSSFQVISNLKTQRLNFFYHVKEDTKTHQASFELPEKVRLYNITKDTKGREEHETKSRIIELCIEIKLCSIGRKV